MTPRRRARRAARIPTASDRSARSIAPVASVVGLLIVAFFTLSLLNGQLPLVGAPGGGPASSGGNVPGVARTPAPSNVVVVEPEAAFPGSIVYAKAGNIWIQTGKDVRQLTTSGNGLDAVVVAGRDAGLLRPHGQRDRDVAVAGQAHPLPDDRAERDASSTPTAAASPSASSTAGSARAASSGSSGSASPVASPDGKTLALVSDAPDPTKSDVILQTYDLARKKSTDPQRLRDRAAGPPGPGVEAGRHDAAVRPQRPRRRQGARRRSTATTSKTKKAVPLTGPGYLEPTYSPDGRYIAATKTGTFGTDIVILDASRGRELLRVTNDGGSLAPVWSPKGDAIAFLHIEGQIVDLRMAVLGGSAPDWTVTDTKALTEVSGLDGASRPGWFIPASELPAPTPAPTPVATPSASASSSAPAQ